MEFFKKSKYDIGKNILTVITFKNRLICYFLVFGCGDNLIIE
jgi:hypothetical protein